VQQEKSIELQISIKNSTNRSNIVVRNTLVGRLRPWSARGRLQIKPKQLCFYPRDVVSAVYATATWLAGWLGGWLSVMAGIVS